MLESATNLSLLCVASSHAQAEVIVGCLHEGGFLCQDVSIVLLDESTSRNFTESQCAELTALISSFQSGAGFGANGALDWLTDLGPVTVPCVVQFIAAGPLKFAMLDAREQGFAGDFPTGFLLSWGLPPGAARRYAARLREEKILISVHTRNAEQLRQAEEIFKDMAASDIGVYGTQSENQSIGAIDRPEQSQTH